MGRWMLTFLLLLPATAGADTICVNTSGSGGCFATLQLAVDAAGKGDVIEVAAGSYVENVVVPAGSRLTIRGAGSGSTMLDGNGAGVALALPGPSSVITISDIAFSNGTSGVLVGERVKASLTDCAITGSTTSGGLFISRRTKVTVTRCDVTGNTGGGIHAAGGDERARSRIDVIASNVSGNVSAASGGGIGTSAATLRVIDSTVSNNAAGATGGGIRADILTVTGSTISGNTITGLTGGGIYTSGFPGQTKITNSTISGNTSAGHGGGIWSIRRVLLDRVTLANNTAAASSGGIRLPPFSIVRSTIIADNAAPSGPDCTTIGTTRVQLGALVEDPTGCSLVPVGGSPLLSGDPDLLPLQDNGGPTETHALGAGSSALGVLTKAGACSRPDQRGVARSAPCDLGAFEAP